MKLKFALFELFLVVVLPLLSLHPALRLAESGLIAYTMWLVALLTVRGLIGLGWDLYVGLKNRESL